MFGFTEEQIASFGLTFGVGAFMLYMLFIIGHLAWESKAGKFPHSSQTDVDFSSFSLPLPWLQFWFPLQLRCTFPARRSKPLRCWRRMKLSS